MCTTFYAFLKKIIAEKNKSTLEEKRLIINPIKKEIQHGIKIEIQDMYVLQNNTNAKCK